MSPASFQRPPAQSRKLWMFAAALLGLLLPLGLALRAWRTPLVEAPLAVQPAWVHLVLISASELELPPWPPPPTEDSALARLARSATSLPALITPASDRAAAAASLWTGLYPAGHGVYSSRDALAPGTWTLASAARASGAATAAFLAEPFVDATGIEGFEQTVQTPGLQPAQLGRLGADFLEQHREQRALLWLHLSSAGPAELEALLLELERALPRDGRRIDSLIAIVGFGTRAAQGDARLVAPWLAQLPAALFAGRSSRAQLSLVDATGALLGLLRLNGPASSQTALHSRTAAFEAALKGAPGSDWILVQRPEGDVFLLQGGRLETSVRPAEREADYLFAGELQPSARQKFAQSYREQLARLSVPRPRRAALLPEAWRTRPGW